MIKAISCSKFIPKFSVSSSARLCPSCPNEPNVRKKIKSARDGPSVRIKGRAVRTVRLSERCPSDIWGFVRPKAEPRLFCPSRAELSENPNVRMSTPVLNSYRVSDQLVVLQILAHNYLDFFPARVKDKVHT